MIEIPEKLKEGTTMFTHVCSDCDCCDDLYECSLDVKNSEYPLRDNDDYRAVVLEVAHIRNQAGEWGWSYDIIYNAYGDNHYATEYDAAPSGSCFETCEEAMDEVVRTYNSNVDNIKKFVAELDEYYNKVV